MPNPYPVNPELIKRAHAAAATIADQMKKESFVPAETFKAAQGGAPGMPPGMPPGGAPPMDPAAMGGMPPGGGPPVDPMTPGAPMPPAPPMPPGAPMPPEGGMPPEGEGGTPVTINMEDLVALFEQISGQEGSGEGDNEPTTTNVAVGKKVDDLVQKVDDMASMLAQIMGIGGGGPGGPPPGEGGAMPPGGEGEVPPELLSQLEGGGAPPMGPEGAPMDPAMAGGMPQPMAMPGGPPGMPPGGGMMQQAGDEADEGITKRSAMKIGELAAKLRKK